MIIIGLFMIVLLLLGVVAFIGLYALFCNFIFRMIFNKVKLPERYQIERYRERVMTLVVFVSLTVWQVGIYLLPLTYILGIWQHFIERRAAERGQAVSDLPRIPRVSLDELLVMTFSLACFPPLFIAVANYLLSLTGGRVAVLHDKNNVTIAAMATGLLIFPLCFVSALHRLNSNQVPRGFVRMLFLFSYPYMFLSTELVVPGPIIIWFTAIEERDAHPEIFSLFLLSCIPWILLIFGERLSRAAWAASQERNERTTTG